METERLLQAELFEVPGTSVASERVGGPGGFGLDYGEGSVRVTSNDGMSSVRFVLAATAQAFLTNPSRPILLSAVLPKLALNADSLRRFNSVNRFNSGPTPRLERKAS